MDSYAEQLLQATIQDSFSDSDRDRLVAALDSNAPMREDVVRILAQFKVNLGPFFLHALLELLEGEDTTEDPVTDALHAVGKLPAAEICEQLADAELPGGGHE